MKHLFKLSILFFGLGITVTCKKENQPPIIQSITASPQTIKTGKTTQLTCVATDPEGDQLSYSWSSTNGTFPNGTSGDSVTWKAPGEPWHILYKTSEIFVSVNDGKNVVDDKVIVEVLQTSNVEGYVYYSGTLIPISGVTVLIDDVSFTTDESGSFKLESIVVGSTTISASKSNFDSYSKDITINKGTNLLNIEMTSDVYTHNVSGYTSDEFGSKISGVQVSILNPDESVSTLTTTSDATGYYQLSSVPQGNRFISFAKKNFQLLKTEIFISNSDYSYSAVLIHFKIQGYVTDDIDIPLSNVEITILNSDGSLSSTSTSTDNNGYFQLTDISEGSRNVLFEKEEHHSRKEEITISNDNNPYNLDIKLLRKTGEFVDVRDENEYGWVSFGDHIVMSKNLAYLPKIYPPSSLASEYPRYYVYGYTGYSSSTAKLMDNYKLYGVLYNYSAAKIACPEGWHLPSDKEWQQLAQYVSDQKGPYNYNGNYWPGVGKHLKATNGWNNNSNGTDDFGFSGFPGGYLGGNGDFVFIGRGSHWWSATETSNDNAWFLGLTHLNSNFFGGDMSKEIGFSVRCFKD